MSGFRNGNIPIDNLGVVNTDERLPDGKPLFWYFVKSPKDESGAEFTIRSAYPTGEEMRRLSSETDTLLRRSGVIYGLIRSFSRLVLPGGEDKGCTIDLRDDHCGSVRPAFGVNLRLKTIEVEVDPTLKGATLDELTADVHDKIKALGALQTSIRIPHLSRNRKTAESLRDFLKNSGAREVEYVQIYPDLMSQNEISPGE